MPEATRDEGFPSHPAKPSPAGPLSGTPPTEQVFGTFSIPKNRSTGNLLAAAAQAQSAGAGGGRNNPRYRFSLDAGTLAEYEASLAGQRASLLPEHEHGLGASGLRRIRQGPPSRGGTLPNSPEASFAITSSRSSSMILGTMPSSVFGGPGPMSPTLKLSEDLTRFPSESLHSFSFAHQTEELLHIRQNVLKKTLEYMRDRPQWMTNQHPGIMSAQAKLSGDVEMQSMMELLSKANVMADPKTLQGALANLGSMTGPPLADTVNVFEKQFAPRADSPELFEATSPAIVVRPETSGGLSSRESQPESPQSPGSPKNDSAASGAGARSPTSGRREMKRTLTDTAPLTLQTKLADALAKPFMATDPPEDSTLLSPNTMAAVGKGANGFLPGTHGQRWTPAAQAIFTTEAKAPWTILAANDLACLVFGVTRAEVRKLGILEVVRKDRREWLEEKLSAPGAEADARARKNSTKAKPPAPTSTLNIRSGITAMLLSKPSSRQSNRSQTDDGSGSSLSGKKGGDKSKNNHNARKSRGVLICGDVVPIQKRNGATGSASLWVKEKKGGLIWVVEEIVEDTVTLTLDECGRVLAANGSIKAIWGERTAVEMREARKLIPRLPVTTATPKSVDFTAINKTENFTARNPAGYNIPISVSATPSLGELRASSFPHIAGILVLCSKTLKINSSNSVFAGALFGQKSPDGLHITELIPHFAKLLDVLTEEEGVDLVDGIVVPEQSFRRARALLALKEGNSAEAANMFLRPAGLSAKHRDGSEIHVDVQMRVVKSEPADRPIDESVIEERVDDSSDEEDDDMGEEVVYALWVTYSRHLHSVARPAADGSAHSPGISMPGTPPRQPSPGQSVSLPEPPLIERHGSTSSGESTLTQKIKEATSEPISAAVSRQPVPVDAPESTPPTDTVVVSASPSSVSAPVRKKISDFVILEDMGQGAYGQVKLARYSHPPGNKVVLKYVTKKRILVDTWTRDRKLGTVPLEIHVLDYLRRDGLRHPNIVEMIDFFEDDTNYYIEMVPHGLPGMDLFDYIEMRTNMDESECRNIFLQVVDAIHHLHTKANVVHRDIKDENIILDGENHVKLIDFGSAAYIKNGPFDVFVGTIDYAAPEVLQGKRYNGKPQDVWALGILLYTLIYKENPFYSVDEILDHELRVPWVMSEPSIDLVRAMLNRDVEARIDIEGVREHEWCRAVGSPVVERGSYLR